MTEFNYDVTRFVFLPFHPGRENKRRKKESKKDETRQRDQNNNITTVPTQCGFFSPAERRGLRQKEAHIQSASSQ